MTTIGETLSHLRHAHSQTKYRQLSYDPVYFSSEEVHAAIDELEKHVLMGEKLTPLQSIAVKMLLNDMRSDQARAQRAGNPSGN